MGKIIFTEEQLNNIYHLYYDERKTIRNLMEIYNCSQSVMDRIFKENSWTHFTSGQQHTKYSVDEHFFDKIDTPDKAYCMGLFYADGCNLYEYGDISVELQINDYNVLKQINNLVSNTREIKIYSSEGKKNRTLDTCVMRIHSHYMCEQMCSLNFIPRKSLTLDFPYWMDNDLIPYMLRGYIDGDGWVQQYRIGFMSTDKFCAGVKQYLNSIGLDCHIRDMKKHYDERTKTLDITNRKNILPLVDKMFNDGSIFMKRKVDRYIKYNFLKLSNNSLID